MNRLTTLKKIKDIAIKNGVTHEQALQIGRSQFEFVAMTMKAGDMETTTFKTILLPKFGKFMPSAGKVKRVSNARKRKLDGVTDN